jgi:hypothetical protein
MNCLSALKEGCDAMFVTEVPKLTDEVGVAEAEKLAAQGAH